MKIKSRDSKESELSQRNTWRWICALRFTKPHKIFKDDLCQI